MSTHKTQTPRVLGGALLMAFLGALGCQSIADIPDVTFSALCKQYCDTVLDNCSGSTKEQYEDARTCLEVCVGIDTVAKSSTQTKHANTVQCRIELAKAARASDNVADAEEFCSYAGPGGGSSCTVTPDAPDCESYCGLLSIACGTKRSNLYAGVDGAADFSIDNIGTQAECISKCRAIPPAGNYNWQEAKESGNTLGCRLYYLSKSFADPVANCSSAGLRSAGECQTPSHKPTCDDFCLTLTTACQEDSLQVFESVDQCKGVCQALDPGSTDTPDFVNTVGCRNSHAYNALLVSAKDHCPHSGPLGSQVCAANGACDAYCGLAKAACPSDFKDHFDSHDDCIEQCLKLDGATGDEAATYSVVEAKKGGANLQCRGLEVSRALDPSDDQRTDHCPAVFGEAAPCVAPD
jgi:hypothetical protein